MAFGVMLFAVGILFKIQHWPDMFKCEISGFIFAFIGVIIFLLSLIKRQKKIKTHYNTDNKGKLFVTVFAFLPAGRQVLLHPRQICTER